MKRVERAGFEPACDELIFVTSLDTTPNTLQHCRFTYILASTKLQGAIKLLVSIPPSLQIQAGKRTILE